MRDRIPTPGKENRVKITQDDGQVIEGVFSYADEAIQEGSFYNKANVLPDEVCDHLGIDRQTAEPKDGFSTLFNMIDRLEKSVTYFELASYIGTGAYGSSNPSIITFGFSPDIILHIGYYIDNGTYKTFFKDSGSHFVEFLWVKYVSTTYTLGSGFGLFDPRYKELYGKKSSDGKTFSWYITDDRPEGQYNESGKEYLFLGVKL